MKRFTCAVLTFLLAVLTAFVCVGCQSTGDAEGEVLQSSESVLIIRVTETDGNATLYDVMKKLRANGEIEFVSENSTYGQSLLSVNGVANTSDWSWYWASYTTDEANGLDEMEWEGETWYYSAAGMSSLQVKKGECYMFLYIEYK